MTERVVMMSLMMGAREKRVIMDKDTGLISWGSLRLAEKKDVKTAF